MRRYEMLELDIGAIRQMGRAAGIPSKHKETIIAALAEDYRSHAPIDTAVLEPLPDMEPVAVAQPQVAPQIRQASEQDEAIVWPEEEVRGS